MADLSPDLSVYSALARQQGVGAMSPEAIFGLIQRSRELGTQSGIAAAIRANPNDPTAAYGAAARDPSVFMGFGDVANAVHAQQAQSELGRFNLEQVGKGLAGLYAKSLGTGKADTNDLSQFTATASTYMPGAAKLLAGMHSTIVRSDGTLDPKGLLTAWNTISGGAALPMIGIQTPGGTKGQMPAAAAQYGGFVPQEIPGAAEAGGASPVVSAGQYGIAQKQSEEFQNDMQPLLKMHELATNLGPQGLGKSTELKTDLQNFLIASGGKKVLGADFDENKTYDYEELVKFTRRLADQVSAGGTDARLIQAVGGNPHVGMNQQPFLSVVRYLVAMRRMKQAQFSEYTSTHIDPTTGQPNAGAFGPWSSEFLKQQDPRAYALDLMGADNAKALYSGLNKNPAAKARFEASRVLAEKHGLLEGAE